MTAVIPVVPTLTTAVIVFSTVVPVVLLPPTPVIVP